MLSTDCFPSDVLQRYLRGDIDDTLGDSIEQHLRFCEACEDTVSELDLVDDTLIRTLRLKRDALKSEPQWIEKVAALEPNLDHSESPINARSGVLPSVSFEETGVPAGDKAGTRRFGDYDLLGTLGRGGMSVVFAARHRHLGRDVALKILMPASQQHAISRDRFSREMRVVGGLTHPSIIRATDAGEFQGTLYLVMDKIDGVDLKHAERSEGPLSVADVCAIGSQVARGLQHAHSKDVIHRDIKPSNLMLDRDGNIMILDFGLARVQSGQDVTLQTTIGQLLGTLDYMAPEQASGSNVAAQADIYALGATIFKLLTGTAPHGRSADIPIIEFLQRLANDPAPRLDEKREQVPKGLCDLIDSMLHGDPQQRESSAEVVAEQLEEFADGADLEALVSRIPDQFKPTLGNPRGVVEQTEAVTAPQVSSSRHSAGPVGWAAIALASASLFGFVLMAISMLLKTPDGDFRIESDVLDSLTVEVVDEKDRVALIAVDQGKAETSLRAGRYRIRLGVPSDEVKITPRVIIVSKRQAAIAKITRIESADQAAAIAKQSPVRDPNVAASARIELLAVMDELKKAKTEDTPDEDTIATLRQRASELQALSQPIPTEPVFKGRTLADWTAQMRFEQAFDARTDAAKSVLFLMTKLSEEDLPSQLRMEIGFEAHARQGTWNRSRGGEFSDAFLPEASDSSATRFYRRIDRTVASRHIASQLFNDDPEFWRHALDSCLGLKYEIREKQWPELLSALGEATRLPGDRQPFTQLTLAFCCPDDATASKGILGIDLEGLSVDVLSAMLASLSDVRLEIPRNTQLVWTSHYVSHPDGGYVRDFQDRKTLLGGPFAEIDWDNVNDSQQADIDIVAHGLLDRLEKAMENATPLRDFTTNEEHTSHQAVAKLISKLVSFVLTTSLGDTQAERAIALLQRRIGQLVTLRDQSRETHENVFNDLNEPAIVATSILLLGGEVPQSLKAPPKPTSKYFMSHLPSPEFLDKSKENYSTLRKAAGWFPYQVMPALDDAKLIRDSRTGVEQIIRTVGIPIILDWLPNSSGDSYTFFKVRSQFAYPSNGGARRMSDELQENIDVLRRHPGWRKRVQHMIHHSENQSALTIAVGLWNAYGSSEEIDEQNHQWLRDGDLTRTRIAIAHFRTNTRSGSSDFPKELMGPVAAALEWIAKEAPLSDIDMQDFAALEKIVPDAPKFAKEFVEARLASGEAAKNEGSRGFRAAAEILMKHPQEIRGIQVALKTVLGDYSPAKSGFNGRGRRYGELDSVLRMLQLIESEDEQ